MESSIEIHNRQTIPEHSPILCEAPLHDQWHVTFQIFIIKGNRTGLLTIASKEVISHPLVFWGGSSQERLVNFRPG